jgi:predicted Fe-Mo cluster-binding NifX family protein
MNVAIPTWSGRVSPVFDAAGRLLILAVEAGREVGRREVPLPEAEAPERARVVADLGVHVLICGAVSQVLEGMLARLGIHVVSHVCGDVEEILRCYLAGETPQERFGMPGCCRRRRQRAGRRGGQCRGRWREPR